MQREKNPRRHVAFRLPPDLITALDDASKRSFVSKTKVVELVLRDGLAKFGPGAVVLKDPRQRDMFE